MLQGTVERDKEGWTWKGRWNFGWENGENPPELSKAVPLPFLYTFDRPISPFVAESSPGEPIQPADDCEKLIDKQGSDEKQQDSLPDLEEGGEESNQVQGTTSGGENLVADKEESQGKNIPAEKSSSVLPLAKIPPPGLSPDAEAEQHMESKQQGPADKSTDDMLLKSAPSTSHFEKLEPKSGTPAGDVPLDAHTVDTRCPPSGTWKGYFDTPVGRKAQLVRVKEAFSLTFSALKRTEGGQSPTIQVVRVIGRGENMYGPFEIEGSFEVESETLQIQRTYVASMESDPSSRPSRRPRKQSEGGLVVGEPRPTRKRLLSWKKRAASEDETTMLRRRSYSSLAKSSKRLRSDSEGDEVRCTVNRSHSTGSALVKSSHSLDPSRHSTVQSQRKQSSSSSRSSGSGSFGNAGSGCLKLPPVGDPDYARWRASHFLYYCLSSDTVGEAGAAISAENRGSISTKNGQQPMYVVYEGELLNSQRHGSGVCLYSNGLIYEGEWRHDKEHGFGALMSSDRKQIIYRGSFEKGRIHGSGIYYYYTSQTPDMESETTQIGTASNSSSSGPSSTKSWYEGEFKENLRHGTGVYYLPDGSIYNGSFRDNLFSGRGLLTWPDGSVYDGEWKDGRRHGSGHIRVADGFSYEGMWSDNAMDGRGAATYPEGQKFNGLLSNGRREGRGTISFTNGAVYEGRFRDDAIDGQGTMKMGRTLNVPRAANEQSSDEGKEDFMIPLSFQSDMGHIHQRAGFSAMGR